MGRREYTNRFREDCRGETLEQRSHGHMPAIGELECHAFRTTNLSGLECNSCDIVFGVEPFHVEAIAVEGR